MSYFVAFLTSFIVGLLLVKFNTTTNNHNSWHHSDRVQKVHNHLVSRLGGLAIFFGILAGFVWQKNIDNTWLIVSLLPIFIAGIIEDFSGKIPPQIRLITSFISALMVVLILDIDLTRLGWDWLDSNILSIGVVSIGLSVFMLGGVTHAANIIDGFNGLLLGYALLALAVFLWVAFAVGDFEVVVIILTTLAAIGGLWFLNFPKAHIFSGDGGAYLLGFLLATIALLLVKNHSEVSPWMPLLVMVYPVFETIFSMFRRFKSGAKLNQPDALHLHSLLYSRVLRTKFTLLVRLVGKNPTTTILVLILTTPFVLPALFWWDNHLIMLATTLLFCCCHLIIYAKISKIK